MKHISYNREQTGKCYFEDTTIFSLIQKKNTMKRRKSMQLSQNLRII